MPCATWGTRDELPGTGSHEPTLGYKCSRPKPRATNPSGRGTMAEKPQVSRGKERS
jgi:hypothetical protein